MDGYLTLWDLVALCPVVTASACITILGRTVLVRHTLLLRRASFSQILSVRDRVKTLLVDLNCHMIIITERGCNI